MQLDNGIVRKLTIFGDSIAAAEGISIHRGWVAQLSEWVDREFPNDWVVTNHSVNGNTSHSALDRIAYEIQGPRADLLIVQFGLNDCNYWKTDEGLPRVSPEAFEANMLEIATRALHFGVKHVFFLTNHPTLRTDTIDFVGKSYQSNNVLYNSIIRRLPQSNPSIRVIDVESNFLLLEENGLARETSVLGDGLHLSDIGHQIYFECLLRELNLHEL